MSVFDTETRHTISSAPRCTNLNIAKKQLSAPLRSTTVSYRSMRISEPTFSASVNIQLAPNTEPTVEMILLEAISLRTTYLEVHNVQCLRRASQGNEGTNQHSFLTFKKPQ